MKWVLVTGCSTGIGRALVAELRKSGWGVVATARRLEALADLPEGSDLRRLALDVTDAGSITAAVTACADLELTALVNNAGYGQMGPMELIRPDELRAQLETNVIGLHAMTTAFLPLIRRHAPVGEGRIVHVSSVLGRMPYPMAGAYCASKYAVIAMGETLRLEIGREIPVILVEPGAIQTEFRHNLMSAWGDLPQRATGTRYSAIIERYRTSREKFAAQHGMSAEGCARRIARAMNAKRPPRRIIVGSDSFWGQVAYRMLPSTLFEAALRRVCGITSAPFR